ncbi:N-acetylmuramate alpha-1-phosphate uridylyltransferase MurU [Thalassotalea euphylliae]|uniref:Nucleotidyltransferase family protein n=1 Tax=Thalassotalea euphylliae TaxID=1655234 RepID=A0A3E0UKM2_9GAMM|nr:nucleotidyltransferase family protein [Thalassotalea euphylliae]REL36805.1 nucleotidyltransferase family protein [Thalassotalea euphylliae]
MRAMILAAGRGERMRPLTDHTPKPLLEVKGKALIEYHLEQLNQLGITDVVINHAWLGEQFPQKLGNGSKYGVNIHYSAESDGALETAGGIIKALPLLIDQSLVEEESTANAAQEPFLVINGDVFLSGQFTQLPKLAEDKLAHLWLVENPEHNPEGDFYLHDGLVINDFADNATRFTFSGIALYRPAFFSALASETAQKLALGPSLRALAAQHRISGELLNIGWTDVGTPERLALLNQTAE